MIDTNHILSLMNHISLNEKQTENSLNTDNVPFTPLKKIKFAPSLTSLL